MNYENYKESLLAPQEIIEIFKGFKEQNYRNSIPRDVFFNAVKNSDGAVLYSYSKLEECKDQFESFENDMGKTGIPDEIQKEYAVFMHGWVEYIIGHNGVAYRIYGKNINPSLLYTGLDDRGEVDLMQTKIREVSLWMKIRNLYRRFVDWISNLR